MENIIRPKTKMYVWVFNKLAPIDKGIQMSHAITEYLIKYKDNNLTKWWAKYDKTIVELNGGNSQEFTLAYEQLCALTYCACFHEEDHFGNMTAFCAILTDKVWDNEMWDDINERLATNPQCGSSDICEMYFDSDATLMEKSFMLREFKNNFRLVI